MLSQSRPPRVDRGNGPQRLAPVHGPDAPAGGRAVAYWDGGVLRTTTTQRNDQPGRLAAGGIGEDAVYAPHPSAIDLVHIEASPASCLGQRGQCGPWGRQLAHR